MQNKLLKIRLDKLDLVFLSFFLIFFLYFFITVVLVDILIYLALEVMNHKKTLSIL